MLGEATVTGRDKTPLAVAARAAAAYLESGPGGKRPALREFDVRVGREGAGGDGDMAELARALAEGRAPGLETLELWDVCGGAWHQLGELARAGALDGVRTLGLSSYYWTMEMLYVVPGAPWPPHARSALSLVQGVLASANKGAGLRMLRVGEAPDDNSRFCGGDGPRRLAQTCINLLTMLAHGAWPRLEEVDFSGSTGRGRVSSPLWTRWSI